MVDTNTVNFAIEKISAAISAAAPSIQSMGADYVSYTVQRQVVEFFECIFCMVLSLLLWLPFYIKAKRDDDFNEPLFVVPSFIFGVLFFVGAMCFFCETGNTVLAIKNPKMFTITKTIENAKEK